MEAIQEKVLPLDTKLVAFAIMANSRSHEVEKRDKPAEVIPFDINRERKPNMPKSNTAVAPSRQQRPKHKTVALEHIPRKRGLKYKAAIVEMIDDLLLTPEGNAIEMALEEFGGETKKQNIVAAIHRATKKTVETASPAGSDKMYVWVTSDKFYNMFRPKTQ